MRMVFTHWEFEDDRILRRVNVKGEGDKGSEEYLFADAVSIAQTAKKYNGIIIQPLEFPKNVKSDVTLTFVIAFKEEVDIKRYIDYIENTNGV